MRHLVIILKIKNTYLYAIKYILSGVALSCDHKQIQESLINDLYKKLLTMETRNHKNGA